MIEKKIMLQYIYRIYVAGWLLNVHVYVCWSRMRPLKNPNILCMLEPPLCHP